MIKMDNHIKCPHYNKEYLKKGIGTYIWRACTKEGKGFTQNYDPNIRYKNGTRTAWNKGLNKNIDK